MAFKEKIKKVDENNRYFQGCILLFILIFFIIPALVVIIKTVINL